MSHLYCHPSPQPNHPCMAEFPGPVILITGCSSGFGRAVAITAARRSYRVIATARQLKALDDLKALGIKTLALDVTDSEEDLKRISKEAWSLFGRIDYLINNAAYTLSGAVEECSREEHNALFNTNFFGCLNVTTAFLPYSREQRTGIIVNVSSQAGSVNIGACGTYSASKAAIDSISETLNLELKQHGHLHCVSVQIGAIQTSCFDNMVVAKKSITGYKGCDYYFATQVAFDNNHTGLEDPYNEAVRLFNMLEVATEKRNIPVRFSLDGEAFKHVRKALNNHLDEMEAWKELSLKTVSSPP